MNRIGVWLVFVAPMLLGTTCLGPPLAQSPDDLPNAFTFDATDTLTPFDGWHVEAVKNLQAQASFEHVVVSENEAHTITLNYDISRPEAMAGARLIRGDAPPVDFSEVSHVTFAMAMPTLASPGEAVALTLELKDTAGQVATWIYEDNPLTPDREGPNTVDAIVGFSLDNLIIESPLSFFDRSQVAEATFTLTNPVKMDDVLAPFFEADADPLGLFFAWIEAGQSPSYAVGTLRIITRGLEAP